MKTNKLMKLNLAKQTISKLGSNIIKGGFAIATQSNNQITGCNTNCNTSNCTAKNNI